MKSHRVEFSRDPADPLRYALRGRRCPACARVVDLPDLVSVEVWVDGHDGPPDRWYPCCSTACALWVAKADHAAWME